MEAQFGIRKLLSNQPIVPVVNFTSVSDVAATITKLVDQGINCIEITLRSDCAWQAIEEAIKIKPSGFLVGVGTIVSKDQVSTCIKLKVDFIVSPGATTEISKALNESNIPFLPGVMTPSEIIAGLEKGWDTFKLFPFNLAGGVKALKTYGAVFSQAKFCPTGGLNEMNYKECLELNNVICVGGSWVMK